MSEETCGLCGAELEWADCWQCGGAGGFTGDELMEDDPLWYTPSDFETCDICDGDGGYLVCPNFENHKAAE